MAARAAGELPAGGCGGGDDDDRTGDHQLAALTGETRWDRGTPRWSLERGVVHEDLVLELAQDRARLEPELPVERLTSVAIHR